jgi:hypothetical protein
VSGDAWYVQYLGGGECWEFKVKNHESELGCGSMEVAQREAHEFKNKS